MSRSDELGRYWRTGMKLMREKGLWAAIPAVRARLQRRMQGRPSAGPLEEWLAYYERRGDQLAKSWKTHDVAAEPKVSILVLTYNNLLLSQICLRSIFCNTTYPSYEVIVVDNGSSDGTAKWLRDFGEQHPQLKLILNAGNLGFSAANNQAARAATGEYLAFLNNDTVVTNGWMEGLLSHLRQDSSVGLVGPVTNGTGNEARIPTYYVSAPSMETFAAKHATTMAGKAFDIRSLALYCVITRRDQYEAIGGLDERFGVGMFEDEDLALRYQERGLRVLCAEDVFIHHFWRASFGKMEKQRYARLFKENRRKFEAKWGRPWQPYQIRRVVRPSARTGQPAETPTLSDVVAYQCNICGRTCEACVADLGRELPSCACGSTVRARALIHVLSCELFGRSLALPNFPVRRDLHGWGMSDAFFPDLLARKLGFTNTFLDQEPRFDITVPVSPEHEGTLDFLIASEVFEHVAPPVSRAFENARRLLKPTGVLILTVPYSLEHETREHFPELCRYDFIESDDAPPRLRNITQDGRQQIYDKLVFHDGIGSVLEMRVFSKISLLDELRRAGFADVKIYSEPCWEFGIYWKIPQSLPMAARPSPRERSSRDHTPS